MKRKRRKGLQEGASLKNPAGEKAKAPLDSGAVTCDAESCFVTVSALPRKTGCSGNPFPFFLGSKLESIPCGPAGGVPATRSRQGLVSAASRLANLLPVACPLPGPGLPAEEPVEPAGPQAMLEPLSCGGLVGQATFHRHGL